MPADRRSTPHYRKVQGVPSSRRLLARFPCPEHSGRRLPVVGAASPSAVAPLLVGGVAGGGPKLMIASGCVATRDAPGCRGRGCFYSAGTGVAIPYLISL